MKVEDLNPKAKEAFAKSLIDIGVAIFKTILLLVVVVPITMVAKGIFSDAEVTIGTLAGQFNFLSYALYLSLILVALFLGNHFRAAGLQIFHDLEAVNSERKNLN